MVKYIYTREIKIKTVCLRLQSHKVTRCWISTRTKTNSYVSRVKVKSKNLEKQGKLNTQKSKMKSLSELSLHGLGVQGSQIPHLDRLSGHGTGRGTVRTSHFVVVNALCCMFWCIISPNILLFVKKRSKYHSNTFLLYDIQTKRAHTWTLGGFWN